MSDPGQLRSVCMHVACYTKRDDKTTTRITATDYRTTVRALLLLLPTLSKEKKKKKKKNRQEMSCMSLVCAGQIVQKEACVNAHRYSDKAHTDANRLCWTY